MKPPTVSFWDAVTLPSAVQRVKEDEPLPWYSAPMKPPRVV